MGEELSEYEYYDKYGYNPEEWKKWSNKGKGVKFR